MRLSELPRHPARNPKLEQSLSQVELGAKAEGPTLRGQHLGASTFIGTWDQHGMVANFVRFKVAPAFHAGI